MKKLSLMLALFLVGGCAVENESDEVIIKDSIVEEKGDMPGVGKGGTYSSGCGFDMKVVEYDGETLLIEIPVLCSPFWIDMGDPASEQIMDRYLDPYDETDELDDQLNHNSISKL